MQGREVARRPLRAYADGTHVVGTIHKSNVNDSTLEIEVILSLFHDARIQTSRISRKTLWEQNCLPAK